MAPIERRAQGALPLGEVTGAARQQRQPALEPLEELKRPRSALTRAAASSSASGSSSSRWQIRRHRVAVLEAWIDRSRAG